MGMLGCKWVAIASLATTSGAMTLAWLALECAVLCGLRWAVEGSWRFHVRGLDGAIPSCVVHVMLYAASLAAPFPLLRFPGYLGPLLYCGTVCYQLAVSPLMLLVALCFDGKDSLPRTMLWVLMLSAMALVLVGIALMATYMMPEKRIWFYKHKSLRDYVAGYCWMTRAECELGAGRDASRADALEFAPWVWPTAKVRSWLEGWEQWEEEKPGWFGESWKSWVRKAAPRDAVPPALQLKFEKADALAMAGADEKPKKLGAKVRPADDSNGVATGTFEPIQLLPQTPMPQSQR
jgi:hypothetical protein